MTRILVTGTSSGLGKYLHSNIVDSSGLRRDNFDSVKNENFDIIVHCAFNKQNVISDYKSYLDDNIFLTQRLKDIRHSKFVYVSTIDVYQKDATMYSHFKKFSESMLDDDDLILRCSMMLGDTMKPNHLTRIRDNVDSITLSGESKFDYILMQDIKDFLLNESIDRHKGAIDFISNKAVKLEDVKRHFSSTTKLGDHTYNADLEFRNPVYSINEVYDRSSLENLKRYFK